MLSFLLATINSTIAQTPFFAKKIGGTGYDGANSIAIDPAGNTYITGMFNGAVDFDPGAGTAFLTAVGGDDIFFAKYDASGNYLFAKSIGSTSDDMGNKIVLDPAGNCYITGYYWGTADFDPGAGVANLTPVAYNDIFFAKYDANGNYLYAKSIGSFGNDIGYGITADASGNCYITGFFHGNADFNPGPGTANLSPISGNAGIYFAKYDAGGNYEYAKSIGTSIAGIGHDIAIDNAGNCYITGTYWGSADFDPGAGNAALTAADGWHLYIAGYDATGNYLYASSLGSVSGNNNYSMTADADGNCYLTGSFTGSTDFDPGSGVAILTAMGGDDIYLAKYDALGKLIYAKGIGSTGSDEGNGIAIDASGNAYITGWFEGSVDFDPGAGTANLTTTGSVDIFYAMFNTAGNFVCAKNVGGPGYDWGAGIAMDHSGNCYITGSFDGTADFDPGAGISNLSAAGNSDIFIVKTQLCNNPLPTELISFRGLAYNQYNMLYWQTATELNTHHFTIEKSNAGISWQAVGSVAATGNSNAVLNYEFTDADILDPVSYYRLKIIDNNGSFTYSGVVHISKAINTRESLALYPNPARDILHLQYNATTENTAVKIINALGVSVFAGNNTRKIDVAGFAAGIYFVSIQQGRNLFFSKFIKQ